MKKQLTALLLTLVMLLSLASCAAEHIPAIDPSGTGITDATSDTTDNVPDSSDTPDDPNLPQKPDEDAPFVISVIYAGSAYLPDMTLSEDAALKVRLSDGASFHTERVGEDGTVSLEGLDGDYSVTLLNVPDGYTYNPNIYSVSNDSKNVSVELLTIGKTLGNGKDKYNAIRLNKTGVYRATIKKAEQVVFYQFTPTKAGRYSFESMMDITAEMYNPKAEVYTGTFAAWYYNETLDGGGPSGQYTKNFKHVVEVPEEFLGSNYLIGVLVEGKDAVYPAYVDFAISYLGTASYEEVESNMVYPEFIPGSNVGGELNDNAFLEWRDNLRKYLEDNKALFNNSDTYNDAAMRIDGKLIFDEDYYKLNPDDGLYHRYDLELYASTNGWGPVLYADITSACIFMAEPLNVIEYQGNKALTVCEGTLNYKLFIEGYDPLTIPQGDQSGAYFCNSNCPCYLEFDENKPNNNGGMCAVEEKCTQCNSTCRHLPEKFKYQKGYSQIVNEDGRAPVTEELKIFLQRYSESQRLFSDGNGWAETSSPRYDAYEDSQWLFACGYYGS